LEDQAALQQTAIRISGGGRPSAFETYENLGSVIQFSRSIERMRYT
jgi:hypothetical protein